MGVYDVTGEYKDVEIQLVNNYEVGVKIKAYKYNLKKYNICYEIENEKADSDKDSFFYFPYSG